MNNIKIKFSNERIIPASGLSVVGAILSKSDFVKRCNRMDVTPNRSQHQIKNGDILLTYIGMLYMGKPQYQAGHQMDDDQEFYKYALGITRPASPLRKHCVREWTILGIPCEIVSLQKMWRCCT